MVFTLAQTGGRQLLCTVLKESRGEVLGSLCPVEDPPWAVVTAREAGEAFAALRSMARRTVLLAVATGLVAMLAGGLLARRITIPLRRLAEVTSAVAQGELDRRAHPLSGHAIRPRALRTSPLAAHRPTSRRSVAAPPSRFS